MAGNLELPEGFVFDEPLSDVSTGDLTLPEGFAYDEPRAEPTFFESAATGLQAGLADIESSIGSGLQFIGQQTGLTSVEDIGRETFNYWNEVAEGKASSAAIQGSIFKDPGLLKNPKWWSYNLARTTPSLLASMLPAIGAAKYLNATGKAIGLSGKALSRLTNIGAAATGGTAGGVLEASSTFQESLARGDSKDEAAKNATMMFAATASLNALSVGKMLGANGGVLSRFFGGGLAESITEFLEEPAEAAILGKDVVQSMKDGLNVVPIAFLTGGLAGAVLGTRESIQKKVDEIKDTTEIDAETLKGVKEAIKDDKTLLAIRQALDVAMTGDKGEIKALPRGPIVLPSGEKIDPTILQVAVMENSIEVLRQEEKSVRDIEEGRLPVAEAKITEGVPVELTEETKTGQSSQDILADFYGKVFQTVEAMQEPENLNITISRTVGQAIDNFSAKDPVNAIRQQLQRRRDNVPDALVAAHIRWLNATGDKVFAQLKNKEEALNFADKTLGKPKTPKPIVPPVIEETPADTVVRSEDESRQAQSIADDLDLVFNGIQETPEGMEDLFLFTIKDTGATFAVTELAEVPAKLQEVTATFADEESEALIIDAEDHLIERVKFERRVEATQEIIDRVKKKHEEAGILKEDVTGTGTTNQIEIEEDQINQSLTEEERQEAIDEIVKSDPDKMESIPSVPTDPDIFIGQRQQLSVREAIQKNRREKGLPPLKDDKGEDAKASVSPELKTKWLQVQAKINRDHGTQNLTEDDLDIMRRYSSAIRQVAVTEEPVDYSKGNEQVSFEYSDPEGDEALDYDAEMDENQELNFDDTTLYSGMPLNFILRMAKSIMGSTYSKGHLGMSDSTTFMNKTFRVPFWNKHTKEGVEELHKSEERRPNEATNIAEGLMESYFDLPKKSSARANVNDGIVEGDRIGKWLSEDDMDNRGWGDVEKNAYTGYRSGISYLLNVYARDEAKGFFIRTMSDDTIASEAGLKKEKFNNLGKRKKELIRNEIADQKATDFVADNERQGYYPRFRFGRFLLVVTRASDNKVIHSEGFDLPEDANANLERFINTGEGTRVVDLNQRFDDYRQLMATAVYLPQINKLMGKAGVEDPQLKKFNELLTANFAGGRLTRRKGELTPGFSEDVEKSVKQYVENFPRGIARRFNGDKWPKIIESMPTDELKGYMSDLVKYFHGETSREGKINIAFRKALYMHYLMLKPAFGILNWTQRLTMTAPWTVNEIQRLGNKGGVRASKEGWERISSGQGKEWRLVGDLALEWKKLRKKDRKTLGNIIQDATYLNENEKRVLLKLYRQGELRELRQLEIGGTQLDNSKNRLLKAVDIAGFLSERSNRIHAAIVGANLYADYGLKGEELIKATDSFLSATQILYSKANRPVLGRGKLAPAFIFKSYMFNFLNMYYNLLTDGGLIKGNKAAFANGVAVMLTLGGLAALPFYTEEIEKSIDFYMVNVKKVQNWPLIKAQKAQARNEKWGKVIFHGVPAALGIDASPMVGFPDFLSLAAMPLIRGAMRLPNDLTRDDLSSWEKVKFIMPSQFRKWKTVKDLLENGTLTGRDGKPLVSQKDLRELPRETRQIALEVWSKTPKEYTWVDKLLIATGFPTLAVNESYRDGFAIKQSGFGIGRIKSEMNKSLARAIYDGDKKEEKRLLNRAKREGIRISTKSVIGHLVEYNELRKENR